MERSRCSKTLRASWKLAWWGQNGVSAASDQPPASTDAILHPVLRHFHGKRVQIWHPPSHDVNTVVDTPLTIVSISIQPSDTIQCFSPWIRSVKWQRHISLDSCSLMRSPDLHELSVNILYIIMYKTSVQTAWNIMKIFYRPIEKISKYKNTSVSFQQAQTRS